MTKVTVEVPDSALFPLFDRAEAADMTVAEYLVRAGLGVAGITEKRESTIGRLVVLGMTDAQIARRLNATNATNAAIAQKRRQLGMPANRVGKRGEAA